MPFFFDYSICLKEEGVLPSSENISALVFNGFNTEVILNYYHHLIEYGAPLLFATDFSSLSTTTITTFVLIVAAEMGDKSQLVCMALAAKHRAKPVLLGAVAAFLLLNSLAVSFGVLVAKWFPAYLIASVVAVLFAVFGIHALKQQEEDESVDVPKKSSHSIFISTFLLITVAEFGDKTQLAVVALSTTSSAIAVWIGATLALMFTSALGVILGRTLLKKYSSVILHRISGLIFLILAGVSAYKAFLNYSI